MFPIPELKIGLLNAWIPILGFNIFMMIFPQLVNRKGAKRAVETFWYTKKDKIFMFLSFIFWYGQLVYAVWVPIVTSTIWFYTGVIISITGLIFYTIANVNYVNALINEAITNGMYKISRNPMYFFSFLIITGIALISSSWVLFFIMLVYGLITYQIIKGEERYCLKTYGLEYREYMKKVPRYFLFFEKEMSKHE